MARVNSHVIRGKNISKLMEYDLSSQKHTVTVASELSQAIPMPTGLNLNFYEQEFVYTTFQIFRVFIFFFVFF